MNIKSRFALILWLTANLMAGCRQPDNHGKEDHGKIIHFDHLVDLTYTLTSEFPFIPVRRLTFPFSMTPMATLSKNGVAANTWHIHEHLGTHIDAPNHFAPDGISVDQIRPEDLIVPVVVIDIRKKASADRDAELTVDDLRDFEAEHGRVPEHSCVMML